MASFAAAVQRHNGMSGNGNAKREVLEVVMCLEGRSNKFSMEGSAQERVEAEVSRKVWMGLVFSSPVKGLVIDRFASSVKP